MELLCYRISIAWEGLVQSECASAYRNTWMDRFKALELELSTTWGCWSIQMRPLEGHLELPDGCPCCYCRPFPVVDLDGPNIEALRGFREIPRALFQSFQLVSYYQSQGSSLFLFRYSSFCLVFSSVKGPKSCSGSFFSRTSSSNTKGPAALDQTLVTSPPLFSVCLCLTGSTV